MDVVGGLVVLVVVDTGDPVADTEDDKVVKDVATREIVDGTKIYIWQSIMFKPEQNIIQFPQSEEFYYMWCKTNAVICIFEVNSK